MNVIMFHSVGNTEPKWYRNWLSVSLNQFDFFCRFLKNKDYITCHLDEWYILQDEPNKITKKHIAITFDDGYLDNWVFAYPILKKYNLKGTIFINPEFVNTSKGLRQNYNDVLNGRLKLDELKTLGFLNWDEIKALDQSGIMDVQSHSMSHNHYYTSNKLVDIYEGSQKYDWLAWIQMPNRKALYLEENQKHFTPFGFPIFESGRALGLRRYFPDQRLIDFSINYYNENKYNNSGKIFNALNEKLKFYPGRFESNEQMEKRYRYELFESKRILEQKLYKKVEFLCWPGGGYNDLSISLSVKAGYRASTIASWDNNSQVDNSGEYKRIRRFGLGSFFHINGRYILQNNKKFLIHSYLSKSGNKFFLNYLRICKYISLMSVLIRNKSLKSRV